MYKKGRRAERTIVEKFWELEYAAVRIPGSGRGYKRPHPDIIAMSPGKKFIIQAKATSSTSVYVERKDIEGLKWFAERCGATALLIVAWSKPSRAGIRVYTIDNLEETKSGLSFRADSFKGVDMNQFFRGEEVID